MMLKSKRTAVSIAVAVVMVIGYVAYAVSDNAPATGDLKGWASLILIFIVISVVAQIIVQIAVHVVFAASVAAKVKDKRTAERMIESEMAEDEMDKRITLRSSHVGYGCAGVGFVITLLALALSDISASLMLNMMLMVFFISMVADSIVSIYLYEKGDNAPMFVRRDGE